MGLLDLFSNKKSDLLKNHITNLLIVANADGEIDENEYKLICTIAEKSGLSVNEFDKIVENIKVIPPLIPKTLEDKVLKVRQLFSVAIVDGHIHENEYVIIRHIAYSYGLNDILVDVILEKLLLKLGCNISDFTKNNDESYMNEQKQINDELDDINIQLDEIEKILKG